jgi:hypothetical protein
LFGEVNFEVLLSSSLTDKNRARYLKTRPSNARSTIISDPYFYLIANSAELASSNANLKF